MLVLCKVLNPHISKTKFNNSVTTIRALKQKFVCFFVILLVCAVWRAEGRYLPTRSDSSRYEHIKEILRALMDLNESESHSGRQNYMYDDVLRSKRATADQKIQETVVA